MECNCTAFTTSSTAGAAKISRLSSGARGEYAKAEPLNQEALQIQRKVLGSEHSDAVTSLGNLAVPHQSWFDALDLDDYVSFGGKPYDLSWTAVMASISENR